MQTEQEIAKQGQKKQMMADPKSTKKIAKVRYLQTGFTEPLFIFRFDQLWQFLWVVFTIVSAFTFDKIYIFQTDPAFANKQKGSFELIAMFVIPLSIIFILIDRVIHKYFDSLCLKYYINSALYPAKIACEQRCYLLVKWGYSIVYYSISSLCAYLLLRQSTMLPPWLGGLGDPSNFLSAGIQIDEYSTYMLAFYLVQFGKHLGRLITHLFIKEEGKFIETAFHHSLSVLLIAISFLTNMWLIGIFVLFVHDISDTFFILARAYKDYRHRDEILLSVIGAVSYISWVFFRIIVFTVCCWGPALEAVFFRTHDTAKFSEIEQSVLKVPLTILTIMLIALQILQLFWTFYLSKAVFAVIFPSLFTHTYD